MSVKVDGDLGSGVRLAPELKARLVHRRGMLDDGKAESRAAELPGMAFVHAVKPLEHPVLVLIRNADARIRHGQNRFAAALFRRDGHAAAGTVILYGVIAEVIDKLLQRRAHALYDGLSAAERREASVSSARA